VSSKRTEPAERPAPGSDEVTTGEQLQSWIRSNLGTISVLSFLLVAIKVFRVSDMETSTALAVITTADTGAVVRGVLISLLPAFLAVLIASYAWWRSQATIRGTAFPLRRWVAWLLFALSMFIVATVAFVVLLALFLVMIQLIRTYGPRRNGVNRRRFTALQAVSFVSAALALYFMGTFALERTSLWVPEERVTFAAKDLAGHVFPPGAYPHRNVASTSFIGYVLREGDPTTPMLVESERGAVRIFIRVPGTPTSRTVCLADPPSSSWFYRRPIQVLGTLSRHVPLIGWIIPQLEQGAGAQTPYDPCFA
jgi:hypothetical protein